MPSSQKKQRIELAKLRKKVERIDQRLLVLLKSRFYTTERIQGIKGLLGLARNQPNREKQLLIKYRKQVSRSKVPVGLIKKVFSHIFSYSKRSGIIR